MITADTITAEQIKALRGEALAADDSYIDWCDLALAAHERSDSEGFDLIAPATSRTEEPRIVTRTKAREVCADAINYAAGEDGTEGEP